MRRNRVMDGAAVAIACHWASASQAPVGGQTSGLSNGAAILSPPWCVMPRLLSMPKRSDIAHQLPPGPLVRCHHVVGIAPACPGLISACGVGAMSATWPRAAAYGNTERPAPAVWAGVSSSTSACHTASSPMAAAATCAIANQRTASSSSFDVPCSSKRCA